MHSLTQPRVWVLKTHDQALTMYMIYKNTMTVNKTIKIWNTNNCVTHAQATTNTRDAGHDVYSSIDPILIIHCQSRTLNNDDIKCKLIGFLQEGD